MRKSLSARLTYRIMAVVLVMMVIIASVVYLTVREYMLDDAKERYLNVLRKIQVELRRVTTMVDMATLNNAHDIEGDLNDPAELFRHVERMVRLNDDIACCYIMFEPNSFPDKGRLFIPCARKDAKGEVKVWQIDSTYQSYFSEVWFHEQIKKDTCDWTKPYLESLAFAGNEKQRLLKTFTVPLHNREGRPVALLCSDMSLENMRDGVMTELERVHKDYEQGCNLHSYNYSFLYNGTYINHPDKQRIVSRNFVDDVKLTPDTLDDHALKDMMINDEGSAMFNIDGVPSWVYYQNIKLRRLVNVIVVPESVIFYHGRNLNMIILLTMIVGLIAIYLFCRRQIKGIADPFAAQKAVLERELTIAHNIQMALLPKPFPQHADIDLYASQTPARDVGGDLYDYFLDIATPHSQGEKSSLVFCIGDVSGKGVPAALLMAVMRSMFRSEARRADSATAIVEAMNRNLCEEYTGGDFITMFVGILDLATGHLDYCNAGHEAPLIGGQPLKVTPNLPIGALSDWNYEGQQSQLESGDMLFLFTDGLSEAMNQANEQFGRKRVVQLAREHCSNTAQQMVEVMEDEVRRHAGGAEQSDDITLLALRWHPATSLHSPLFTLHSSLSMSASMDDIYRLEPFVAHAAQLAGMEERDAKRLRLAVEEAVANIINHGQASAITLQASVDGKRLVLTIDDDGQPFDPSADPPTDLSIPADQRPPGGLGIMLLHQMSDGLDYQRVGGHNVLKIVKEKSTI